MTNYIIAFVISILLFPILLVTGVELVAFDQTFYARQYERLNTAQEIGMSDEDLNRVTLELTDYIRDKTDSLDHITAVIDGAQRKVFNQREIAHMVDVKELFQFAGKVRNFSLIGVLILLISLFLLSRRKPLWYLAVSYLAASALLLLLLLIAVPVVQADFTYYWNQFHYLFFDNDLWILNPATDIMIQMVPQPFFNKAVFRVITYFAAGVVLLGMGSILVLRSLRKRV
jgi:integral membrane protein (TIGR01906 family)